jgi:hypothetical protein
MPTGVSVEIGAEDSTIRVLHLDSSHVVLHSDVSPFDNDGSAPLYDVEETNFGGSCDSEDHMNIPQAYAALSEPLLGQQGPESSLLNNYTLHIATADAQPVGYSRPEFIFAKVIKPSIDSSCGLFLKCIEGRVVITRISEKGLFSKANLRPGDRVISVNGVSCLTAGSKKVASLIGAAPTFCSIAVHNRHGDPRLVSTSIPKPKPTTKVGVTLKNYRGAIHVGRVGTNGLFAGSLLTPGHRCITINDVNCSLLRATDAAQVISNATDIVTIVSEPRQEWAMVLSSCEETRGHWWRRSAIAATGLAGAIAVGVLASMH